MSVLTDTEIEHLATTGNLISPFSKESLEGASYDMRLGAEYSLAGSVKLLSKELPSISIKPGEFAILSTHEMLRLPLDIIGHNGIMSPWAKLGLVSLFSPQIDPGFKGILVVPVYNAGDRPISLRHEQKIFTVEFVRTSVPASYGWSDKHGIQTKIDTHIQTPNSSSFPSKETVSLRDAMLGQSNLLDSLSTEISELKNDILRVKKSILDNELKRGETTRSRFSLLAAWLSLAASIVALTVSLGLIGAEKPTPPPSAVEPLPQIAPKASSTTPPASAPTPR